MVFDEFERIEDDFRRLGAGVYCESGNGNGF